VKTLQQLCAATILSVILAVSVQAGQVESTGAPAPATNSVTTSIVLMVVSLIYR